MEIITLMDRIKHDMLQVIDKIEVDVNELSSYEYSPAVYSWQSSSCGPEEEDWDEEEEWQAKLTYAIDSLKDGFLSDWVNVTEEEDNNEELKAEVVAWLESMQE